MIDPYQMLGVTRKSSTADIKKSYRRLAKELHPDRHPGDGRAAERFKEVASSYSLLNDPAKRARFDRGEIDGQGNERRYRRGQARPGPRARRPGAAGAGASPGAGRGAGQGAGQADEAGPFESFSFENFGFGGFSGEDVFSPFFGNRGNNSRRAQARAQARSLDSRYSLKVNFVDAAKGTTRKLKLENGKSVKVAIPAGIEDGQTVRLKNQGGMALGGKLRGDALVEVRVDDHAFFKRHGSDVHVELPINLKEAVLGAKVEVPTVDGPVSLTIPRSSSSGRTLRLKGKGIIDRKRRRRGDQYVVLKLALPERRDAELERLIGDWAPATGDVRAKMKADS
jgi:DnaJ-class molecular chaperone